jgi:hypothetical protein
MGSTATPAPATEAAPVAAPAKAKKERGPKRERQVTRLVDPSGAVLEIVAEQTKDGFQSWSKHTVRDDDGKVDKELSVGRGTTSSAKTFDEAKSQAAKVLKAATGLGWVVRASVGGGAPRKDAFDLASLPKPAPAPKR